MTRRRTRKAKSTGRFGARYGATIRKRVRVIEAKTKQKHRCPRCRTYSVKRISIGIWECRKCHYVYAGGAWEPITDSGKKLNRITAQINAQQQ